MSGGFFSSKEKLEVRGLMPERALLRLRRAGITLYDVEKTGKDCLRLRVESKEIEKVFAIYPKACYNENSYAPYKVQSLGRTGVGKYLDFAWKRIGFTIGAPLFFAAGLYADGFVFGVEFSASKVYQREAYALLEEYGVKPFSRYQSGNEDLICSKLLSLEGVEFCSVKKSGLRVVVEMRLGDSLKSEVKKGDMQATHTGEILSITALKGTPLKQIGDTVRVGETIVGGWIETADGERKGTEVIARASIACAYECAVSANDEKEAFAVAYLQAEITQEDRITATQTVATEAGYAVRIEYVAIENMNF